MNLIVIEHFSLLYNRSLSQSLSTIVKCSSFTQTRLMQSTRNTSIPSPCLNIPPTPRWRFTLSASRIPLLICSEILLALIIWFTHSPIKPLSSKLLRLLRIHLLILLRIELPFTTMILLDLLHITPLDSLPVHIPNPLLLPNLLPRKCITNFIRLPNHPPPIASRSHLFFRFLLPLLLLLPRQIPLLNFPPLAPLSIYFQLTASTAPFTM